MAIRTVCKILGIESPEEYFKEQARLAVERKVSYSRGMGMRGHIEQYRIH
jgi:hypothetical protein